MSTSKEQAPELFEKDIRIICPKCKSENTLKVPQKIINETKQLTTVSIPADLICEHSFQAFIDKNFIVRGYQQVDFEFSNIEFYESSAENLEGAQSDDDDSISSLPLFQDIIQLLRNSVDDKDIWAVCKVNFGISVFFKHSANGRCFRKIELAPKCIKGYFFHACKAN